MTKVSQFSQGEGTSIVVASWFASLLEIEVKFAKVKDASKKGSNRKGRKKIKE